MGRDVTLPYFKNVLLNLILSLWSLRCEVWTPRIMQRCGWTTRLKHSCGCLCNCWFQAWPCPQWLFLVWLFQFSQLSPPSTPLADAPSEYHCPCISGLDDIPSGRIWNMIFWVPTRDQWKRNTEVQRVTSLGGESWPLRNGREPRSITHLFWPVWTFTRCSSSLQTHQQKTFMPTEQACWTACDIFMLSEVGFSS